MKKNTAERVADLERTDALIENIKAVAVKAGELEQAKERVVSLEHAMLAASQEYAFGCCVVPLFRVHNILFSFLSFSSFSYWDGLFSRLTTFYAYP